MARPIPAALVAALVLSGCAAPRAQTSNAAVEAARSADAASLVNQAGLDRLPPCEQDTVGTLNTGVRIHYKGADPSDPQVCLLEWRGRTRRLFAGFWGSGRYRKATHDEREALRDALTGPVGTKTTFQDSHSLLWGRVTVQHVGNPVLRMAKGNGARQTVKLKIVRHDAFGRPTVRMSTQWIDRRTGILLKRQSITKLASGRQEAFTTWQITDLKDRS